MKLKIQLVLATLTYLLIVSGCTSSLSQSQPATPQALEPPATPSSLQNISVEQNVQSTIQDFMLETMRVEVGTSVTWTNMDKAPHTTTAGFPEVPSGQWDSGTLNQGDSFLFTFQEVGSFPYFCEIHPDTMRATVEVVAQESGSLPNPPDLPTSLDVSLLAVEDHGDDDAEFVLRATVPSSVSESSDQAIELWALDSKGSKTKVAALSVGDRIRLKVGEEEVKVQIADNGNLIDNEFQVLAQADSFEVLLKVTDAAGLTQEDQWTMFHFTK